MEIWLQTNITTHHYIPANFFYENYNVVKKLLPSSTIFVEDTHGIKGFIGLIDNYIAGLFIEQHSQRMRFGTHLINKAKTLYNQLSLHVYKQNINAVNFYKTQDFKIVSEQLNEKTSIPEYLMEFTKI